MSSLVVCGRSMRLLLYGAECVPFPLTSDSPRRLYPPIGGTHCPAPAQFGGFQNNSELFSDASGLRLHPGGSVSAQREANGMNSVGGATREGNAVAAIGIAGLVAGTLDLLQACILFGWHIPKVIAAGLLGPEVIRGGGTGTYLLGVVLHYFIACSATAIFYLASRRLRFMTEHWVVCGLFFGMAVELTMGYVVLPLSALHARGPFDLKDVLLGFGVHMVVVGLPIAGLVRKFAP